MATVYGTQLVYCPEKHKTNGLISQEFWGKGHVQAAQEKLSAITDGESAQFYHVFSPIAKEQ